MKHFLFLVITLFLSRVSHAVEIDGENKGILSSKERIDFRLGRITEDEISFKIQTRAFAQCLKKGYSYGVLSVHLAEAEKGRFADNEEEMQFDTIRREFVPQLLLKSVGCDNDEPAPGTFPTHEDLLELFLKFESESKRGYEKSKSEVDPEEGFVATTPLLTDLNPEFEPFLYRLTRAGQKNDIFLLGTQHNIPLDRFPEIVNVLSSRADLLIEELHITNWERRNFGELSWIPLEKLTALGLYQKSGFGWFKLMNRADQNYIQNELADRTQKQWGTDPDTLHPAVIIHFFEDILSGHYQGRGIDANIGEKFEKLMKPIFALETDEDRLLAEGTLEKLESSAQRKNMNLLANDLSCSIQRVRNSKRANNFVLPPERIKSYSNGNEEEFSHSASCPAVQKRNINWMPKLLNLFKENSNKSLLVMVGVGHFPGPKGLLLLLQAEGYQIRRVSKFGERTKTPLSLCNYIKNKTYSELLLDAAQVVFNKHPDILKEVKTQILRFSDPSSRESELVAYDFENFRQSILALREFDYNSAYSVYEFGPPYYYPNYLRKADFDHAISSVIENARKAKEWTRQNSFRIFKLR